MKVYLDNCCYNRPYDDQSQLRISLETQAKLQIQSMIRNKDIELAEKSDYTKWRQRYFADVTSDEFHEAAVAYAKANPL